AKDQNFRMQISHGANARATRRYRNNPQSGQGEPYASSTGEKREDGHQALSEGVQTNRNSDRLLGNIIPKRAFRWAIPNSRIMARHRLDDIDRQILAELQAEGRMTNVELATRVKITAPPCLRRVRVLEKAGYIKGYHADLDAPFLGYEVTAFAFVGLASQAEGDLRAFEEQARAWPQVRSCHMLSGEVDFILLCVARDLPEFQTF